MAPILVLTLLWAFATYAIALRFANLANDRALSDTVMTVAAEVHVDGGTISVDLPAAARRMLEYDSVDRVYYCVVDADERVIDGNRHLVGHGTAAGTNLLDERVDGQPVRQAEYIPAATAGGRPPFSVRVAETIGKRRQLAREILSYTAVPQSLLIGGIALFLWIGVGRGVAPLARVRDAIAARSDEDLRPLEFGSMPDEISQQVHVINTLMARLRETLQRERGFIADATHQLRTPIAALRMQVDLAQRAADPARRDETLRRLGESVERLQRLANQLLSLGRADAMREQEQQALDIGDLVEEAVAVLVPFAIARDVEVRIEPAEEPVRVRGNGPLCREMIANLVDNAIRYTRRGGSVTVSLRAKHGSAVLRISDDGPGIPASERERVFGRFQRIDRTDVEGGGSGLGLAIAREIARGHHGSISLHDAEPPPGLVVVVELPMGSTFPASGLPSGP